MIGTYQEGTMGRQYDRDPALPLSHLLDSLAHEGNGVRITIPFRGTRNARQWMAVGSKLYNRPVLAVLTVCHIRGPDTLLVVLAPWKAANYARQG